MTITERLAALPQEPVQPYFGIHYTNGEAAWRSYFARRDKWQEARLALAVELLREAINLHAVPYPAHDDAREFLAHIDKERTP